MPDVNFPWLLPIPAHTVLGNDSGVPAIPAPITYTDLSAALAENAFRLVDAGSSIEMVAKNQVIAVDKTVGSATEILLIPGFSGQVLGVLDAKGDAGSNNITITGPINNGSFYVIDTNYGWAHFIFVVSRWILVG